MTTAVDIKGTCDARFQAVKEAFAQNFADFGEVGAAVAVVVDGRTVVDLWAGHADAALSRPWQRDTIANVYSTTKGITAICAHRLADQGLLDIDAPVAKYWPEFAQAGKGEIPVRYLLSHRAGLPAVRRDAPARLGLQLGDDDLSPRGGRALVGARHQARLPRAYLRLARRRGHPPDQRSEPRHVLPQGDRGAARPRLPHRSRRTARRPHRGAIAHAAARTRRRQPDRRRP